MYNGMCRVVFLSFVNVVDVAVAAAVELTVC